MPAVDGFHPLNVRYSGGERVPALAAHVVRGADADLFERVEDVELRERDGVEAVQRRGRAQHRQIEPARAARASRHRAEFVAALAEVIAEVAVQLGRERAAADAGGARLGHADSTSTRL